MRNYQTEKGLWNEVSLGVYRIFIAYGWSCSIGWLIHRGDDTDEWWWKVYYQTSLSFPIYVYAHVHICEKDILELEPAIIRVYPARFEQNEPSVIRHLGLSGKNHIRFNFCDNFMRKFMIIALFGNGPIMSNLFRNLNITFKFQWHHLEQEDLQCIKSKNNVLR